MNSLTYIITLAFNVTFNSYNIVLIIYSDKIQRVI